MDGHGRRRRQGGRIELGSELKLYRTQKPRSSNLFGDELYQVYYRFLEINPSTLVLLLRLLHRRALVYLRTWIADDILHKIAQDVFRECRAAHGN